MTLETAEMQPQTQYQLSEYLKRKKRADAERPPREPSGFMKKKAQPKANAEVAKKRPAGSCEPLINLECAAL